MTGWRQKRRHMRYYSRFAPRYNMRYAEEQNCKIKAAVERLKLREQNSVLDVGCGTGLLISKIHHRVREIIGLDVSKGMLKETENSARKSSNVHLVLADADYIPIRNDCFNMIFAVTLLQNMPNLHSIFREMKRVAKPKAWMVVTGLKKFFGGKNSFLTLLEDVGLKAKLLEADENSKCHIAVCRNRKRRK